MLFPADAGAAGMDALGSKLLQRCLQVIKQKPVVPAYGDVPVALTTTLYQLSPFMAAFGEAAPVSSHLPQAGPHAIAHQQPCGYGSVSPKGC